MADLIPLSHSGLSSITTCPRKYQQTKLLHNPTMLKRFGSTVHTAYGHAVGSGVANWLEHQDLHQALHVAFTAWDVDPISSINGKSLPTALLAVESFTKTLGKRWLNEGYEIAYINGKPAAEVSFKLTVPTVGYYIGYIDVVLYHPNNGTFKVVECKTMNRAFHESIYGNSTQDVSYLFVASQAGLFEGTTEYPVNMALSDSNTWISEPYIRTRADYEQFVKTLLVGFGKIQVMQQLKHFPKEGSACNAWNRICPLYGECDVLFQYQLPRGHVEPTFDIEVELNFDID